MIVNDVSGINDYKISIFGMRNKGRQIVWLAFILLAFILFCFHYSVLLKRYLNYGVISQWGSTDKEVPLFPKVILCNAAPLSWYRSSKGNFTAHGIRESHSKVLLKRVQSFWRLALNEDTNELGKYNRKLNTITRLTMQSYTFNFNISHQIQDALLDCQYKGDVCDMNNFTDFWSPYFHHCHVFVPDDKIISHRGPNHGLSMVMYANDRRGFLTDRERLNWFRGFYIILAEPNNLPSMDNIIEIPTVVIKQTHNIRSLSSSDSCADSHKDMIPFSYHDENGIYQPPIMVENNEYACKIHHLQKVYLTKCECFSDLHLIPLDLSNNDKFACHHVPNSTMLINNGYKLINSTHAEIKLDNKTQLISLTDSVFQLLKRNHECYENVSKHKISKDCIKPCTNIDYSSQPRSFEWPTRISYGKSMESNLQHVVSEVHRQGLDTPLTQLLDPNNTKSQVFESMDAMRQSFLYVNIYAASLNIFVMQESLAYPMGNLLSDFGGTLGLWIGCSVVSLIQVGWVTCGMISHYIKTKHTKSGNNTDVYQTKLEPANATDAISPPVYY